MSVRQCPRCGGPLPNAHDPFCVECRGPLTGELGGMTGTIPANGSPVIETDPSGHDGGGTNPLEKFSLPARMVIVFSLVA